MRQLAHGMFMIMLELYQPLKLIDGMKFALPNQY
jgi:hypothetical protein